MLTETGNDTFVEVQTPSGIEIRYHWEPVRKYEIKYPVDAPALYPGQEYCIDWKEVPSVTTVLDVLDKPGLTWWGQEIGVTGLLQLQHYPGIEWDQIKEAEPTGIIDLLKKHKLTVNHMKDAAGKRGHSVHAAMEGWAKTGEMPVPSIFPAEEKGYVEGLVKFLTDLGDVEDVQCEVMVASLEYGYAGRYDLRFTLKEDRQIAYKTTPVRGPKYAKLKAGQYIIDLKTSKRVYMSHHRQLAGYELASVECGYEPTDARGILHVMPDGQYELVKGLAEAEDFVIILSAFNSERRLKDRKKNQ